ncbi:MAG TPA: DUF1801 domain-containing protein [Pyrinomonadaceae bacterium]|nr:DUF1801 domain-containing protein [Pyrinomonadaceae bacterium]
MSGTLSYKQYLDGLPSERRVEVEKVWRVVRESMPKGYVEEIGPKFITFKAGEDWYVALASQKNYISLYLIPLYVFPELKAKLDASAPRLKCGKSCINFKKADELPLDVIAEVVGANDAEAFMEHCRRVRSQGSRKKKSNG